MIAGRHDMSTPIAAACQGCHGADFGVASSELVLRYAKGDPVVVLASIFQHSPLTLFVRSDAGTDTVQLVDTPTAAVLRELRLHYFVPVIQQIYNIKDEFGFLYWTVETERGKKEFTMRDSIIGRSSVCRLGMSDNGQPYIVPLSFGYDGRFLYVHAAVDGRKVDILKRNNRVCFEFDRLEEVTSSEQACIC